MNNMNLNYNNVSDTNLDLRKEFCELQNKFSFNILYIRASKFIKCVCYDDLYKTGDPDCPFCFGRGKLNLVQKIKAIKGATSYEQLGNTPTQIGIVSKDNEIFYLDNKVVPNANDFIIVTKYNSLGEPVEAKSVFEIQTSIPVNGDHGRVELYCAVCKLRNDKLKSINKTINYWTKKQKTYLAKGMRIKCYLEKK